MSVGVVQRVGFSEVLAVLRLRVPGETRYLLVRPTPGGCDVGLVSAADKSAVFEGKLPAGCSSIVAAEAGLGGVHVLAVGREVLCARRLRVASADANEPSAVADDADHEAREQRDDGAHAEAEMGPMVQLRIAARGGRLVLVDGGAEPHASIAETELRARGLAMLPLVHEAGLRAARVDALRRLKVASAKLERRRQAVASDIVKMDEAFSLIESAQWLIGLANKAPRGTKELSYTDWSSGEAVVRTLALDPARTPKEQVQAMFRRAKRLKLGRIHAERRRAECEGALAVLGNAMAQISDELCSLGDIAAALRSAKAAAPRDLVLPSAEGASARTHGKSVGASVKGHPYRVFVSERGARILVGKGSAANDELTFRVARPSDLFLHAKGVTGAHVVVPLGRNQSCSGDTLVDAAMLAAHFSAARDETHVDVSYVPRKFVRKPRNGVPGQVLIDREKVLALRVDSERLRALLGREEV